MTHDRPGGGANPAIPWTSVFDPTLNVRALGEIQARGFRAATELVDRFVRLTEGATTAPSVAQPAKDEGPTDTTDAGVDRMLERWERLAGQLAGVLRSGKTGTDDRPPVVDLVSATATGVVAWHAFGAGSATAEVWLHNRDAVDLGDVRLRCSDLMSDDGSVISADRVSFDPGSVSMVSRSSRGVAVDVDLDGDEPSALYRGTIFVEGYREVWLPVEFTVTPGQR